MSKGLPRQLEHYSEFRHEIKEEKPYYTLTPIGETGSKIEGKTIYFEAVNNREPIDLADLKKFAFEELGYLKPAFVNCIYPQTNWDLKAILIITTEGI